MLYNVIVLLGELLRVNVDSYQMQVLVTYMKRLIVEGQISVVLVDDSCLSDDAEMLFILLTQEHAQLPVHKLRPESL